MASLADDIKAFNAVRDGDEAETRYALAMARGLLARCLAALTDAPVPPATDSMVNHGWTPQCDFEGAHLISLCRNSVAPATAEETALQARYDALYADSMIAHRWFAARFGEALNGRDFAVKCEIADAALSAAVPSLPSKLNEAIQCVIRETRDFNERKQELRCKVCRYRDPLNQRLHDPDCPIYALHDAWENALKPVAVPTQPVPEGM